MILSELISPCLVKNDWTQIQHTPIRHITQYIEEVTTDSLFVCINNTKYDGHDFISEALAQGARAIIVDHLPQNGVLGPFIVVSNTNKVLAQVAAKFYDYPSRDMVFLGVTGTNGKTTTTFLIHEILRQSDLACGLIGTMYNQIGNQRIATPNTTPHTVQLQKLIAQMAQENMTHCVMEVSSHGLKQERVLGIDFNVAVFTNLTQDHLDFHDSMTDYFEAKSSLFSRLGNGFSDKVKAAVINLDDPAAEAIIALTPSNILTYGCKGQGDIQASQIVIATSGTQFTLSLFDQKWAVSTKMIGLFNVYNCLAAFGAGVAIGLNPTQVIAIIEGIAGVRGRFESVPNIKGITAIVDYAHTPDALINVLKTAKSLTKGKIYCVAGCGGNRDRDKRPKMAEAVLKYADHGIFTSDDPRTEDPHQIINDMIEHLSQNHYEIELDRKKAIEKALRMASHGDTVLIAGKGHETEQMIGTTAFHFDDREVVNQYFSRLTL